MTKKDDGLTEPEAVVVSGEAQLPDEHTRRVAAMKAQRDGMPLPEATTLNVHTDTVTDAEVARKGFETEVVPARAERRSEGGPRFGPPRGAGPRESAAGGGADPSKARAYRDRDAGSDAGASAWSRSSEPERAPAASADPFQVRIYGGSEADAGEDPRQVRAYREPERETAGASGRRTRPSGQDSSAGAADPDAAAGGRSRASGQEGGSGDRDGPLDPEAAAGRRSSGQDPRSVAGERDRSADPDAPASRRSSGQDPRSVAGARDRSADPDAPASRRSSGQDPRSLAVERDRSAEAGQGAPDPASSPDPSAAAKEASSRSLAERSLRDRRRQRDRRAEQVAIRTVLVLFLGLGAATYFIINSDLLGGDQRSAPAAGGETPGTATGSLPKPPVKTIVTSASPDETPDIPALRQLTSEGLTIAAEGLPEVLVESAAVPPALAAHETCRFAYGVWEFSPNKRFRFLTTCGALEGQTLFGAYEVKGSVVEMSPLVDPPAQLMSRFEVEKPSRMSTEILVKDGDRVAALKVNQRVTVLRGGLEGEAFRDTFSVKNTVQLPGARPKTAPGPEGGATKPKDPLLELMKKK